MGIKNIMKIHLKLTLFKIIKNKERHIIETKKILFTEKQRLKKKKIENE